MSATPLSAHWDPEDSAFWRTRGAGVARRNLGLSVVCLTLSFAVWMLWSVVVVHLPAAGFRFTTNQLLWLTALPALSGATLRVFYAFAVPVFGGRRWTAWSTASLLLPTLGMGWALADPGTPYEALVALALLCGLGGGNFASSMAHVSTLFPRSQVGWALGLNAGLSHLGISLAQIVVPAVLLLGAAPLPLAALLPLHTGALPWVAWIWSPAIALAALAAWWGMDDLSPSRSRFAEQAVIFRSRDNWLLCWLYLGTFGSFIGFAAAAPLLLSQRFPDQALADLVWLGPLLGALLRPLGGALSDRVGGARVTLVCLLCMALAVVWLHSACAPEAPATASGPSLLAVLAAGGWLFAAAGIGSSSVFKMVPGAFATHSAGSARALQARNEAAAVLGFASAMGAYGGFIVPKALGTSMALFGGLDAALLLFLGFYLSCIAITWWRYARPGAARPC